MCGGGGNSGLSAAQQQANADAQLAEQRRESDASLALQQKIADQQAQQNQQQLKFQQDQAAIAHNQALVAADDQAKWTASRSARASAASKSINDAFAQFSPDYFKKYAQDYYTAADNEIGRQYGEAQRDTTFGLARSGNIGASTSGDQQAELLQTKGRAEADQANAAKTAASQLQGQVTGEKSSLLAQALSSDVLGQPISPGNPDVQKGAISTSNNAISGITANAGNYAANVTPIQPQTSQLAGIFSSALTGGANFVGGQTAAAYGNTGNFSVGNPSGGSSQRIY